MGHENLLGVWKLLSLQFAVTDTSECRDMYGPDPLGYIFITPDNRMITVITSRGRKPSDSESGDADLFKSMMAYSGRFRIDGADQFVTEVEVSWHPGWVGTEQARTFSIVDDILSITTAETLHPMFPGQKGRGILKWQRTSAF
ncbi:lipocalin-like domain-containing protein [Aquibium sp. LZ166]|uniref:Lipocalin-like domain-containing protein n=1 Tax=Aquibium pacificus TaxID=3153579 RepID=A0ABV3ST51_9HYPH